MFVCAYTYEEYVAVVYRNRNDTLRAAGADLSRDGKRQKIVDYILLEAEKDLWMGGRETVRGEDKGGHYDKMKIRTKYA